MNRQFVRKRETEHRMGLEHSVFHVCVHILCTFWNTEWAGNVFLFPVVPVTPGSGLGVTGEKANRTVQILRSTERKFAFWLTHHI